MPLDFDTARERRLRALGMLEDDPDAQLPTTAWDVTPDDSDVVQVREVVWPERVVQLDFGPGVPPQDILAAQQRKPLEAPEPQQPAIPPVQQRDEELEAARAADKAARRRMALELAARQLVSGIAGRPYTGQLVSQPTNEEERLLQRRRQQQADALRMLELGNIAERNRLQAEEIQRRIADDEAQRKRDEEMAATRRALAELRSQELALRGKELETRGKLADWAMSPDNPKNKPKVVPTKPPPPPPPPEKEDIIPWSGGVLVRQPDAGGDKETRARGALKAREEGAKWGLVDSSLAQLESLMQEFLRNPTIENRNRLRAPALAAAAAVNAALGQGAMSDAEKRTQYENLGINMAEAGNLDVFLEKMFGDDTEAVRKFLSRVRGARELARKNLAAAVKPWGYEAKSEAAPTSEGETGEVEVIMGHRYVRVGDKWKRVD